jgi:tetratricopeptide (TPR) repeat protein
MPDIFWLIAAQRRFCQAMGPGKSPDDVRQKYEEICHYLAATFHDAPVVLVRDRLFGYSNAADKHILLVEAVRRVKPSEGSPRIGWPDFCGAAEETQTTAHIVKIGDPRQLKHELEAWRSCRPAGMTHDSVLMRLRAGSPSPGGDSGPQTIIYEDASHVVGVGTVLSLEQAALDCCQWGTPSLGSLELVLKCIYGRLGEDFYARSEVSPQPREGLQKLRAWLRLDERLKQWADKNDSDVQPPLDLLRIRREALGCLASRRAHFIDPVDYLRSVVECPQFCPLLLWGSSHGDLHGRNILVSVMDGDVTMPAVFDYGDMGGNNPVGWDFVKLETEIKTRALPLVFSGAEVSFIQRVHAFEYHLAGRTQAMHDQHENYSPLDDTFPEGARRLAGLVLAVRAQAMLHLGTRRQRDRQWLEEYYFLLACYGVRAALFDAYQGYRRQIISAYISAGTAARLLDRPWKQLDGEIRKSASDAAKRLHAQAGQPGLPLERLPGEMGHHARLAFAHVLLSEAKDGPGSPSAQDAKEVLQKLREDYPHVLEVEEELAIAYFELGRQEDAEQLLRDVSLRYAQMSEEMLCRFGRLCKNKGDDAESILPSCPEAAGYFQAALQWYQKAHGLSGKYYPQINVATLHFVLGQREPAGAAIRSVLDNTAKAQPADDGERAWIEATIAEARLVEASLVDAGQIEAKCQEAARLYRQAAAKSSPREREAMRRQAQLVLRHAASEVRNSWGQDKLNEVFG